MGNEKPCKILYQEEKENPPYSGPDRRKSERYNLSRESQAIVQEVTERIKNHHLDNCIIPETARPHIQHSVLAVEEIGEGNISYGINKTKDVIKRSYEQFENQDRSRRTAMNSAIKYIVGFVLALIAGALLMKVKDGG